MLIKDETVDYDAKHREHYELGGKQPTTPTELLHVLDGEAYVDLRVTGTADWIRCWANRGAVLIVPQATARRVIPTTKVQSDSDL